MLYSFHCQPYYVLFVFSSRLFSALEQCLWSGKGIWRGPVEGMMCDWSLFGLLPVVCNLDSMLGGQSLKASCCPVLHFLWIQWNQTHKSSHKRTFSAEHVNESSTYMTFSERDNLWLYFLFLPSTAVRALTLPCRSSTGTRRCTRWYRRIKSPARRPVSPTPLKCCKRSWRLTRKVRSSLHYKQMCAFEKRIGLFSMQYSIVSIVAQIFTHLFYCELK